MTKQKPEELIQSTLTDILSKVNVQVESIDVTEVPSETDKSYTVSVKTPETGLLIGHHGETINSLQLLLGVMLYKKMGQWIRVILDVGDYRKMREDNIRDMVQRIVTEVETTGQPVTLPFLTPLERRFVHMMLTDNEKVTSESVGEGKERRLTIKPR